MVAPQALEGASGDVREWLPTGGCVLVSIPSNAVVVRLPHTADSGDVVLDKEVLGKIRDALFRDDEVGFQGNDVVADLLDILLLNLQEASKVLVAHKLDIGLGLALGVLEGTVEEQDAGLLNPA